MNRFPLWKNLLVASALVIGLLYTLPNLFGQYPAVQVSATRTAQVDETTVARVKRALDEEKVGFVEAVLTDKGVRIRFEDTDTQIRARDVVQKVLGQQYIVALSLLPNTPAWLQAINAKPMNLGLDLRGGVHLLLQVDMRAVLKKAEETAADDARRILREKKVRYQTVTRGEGGALEIRFRDAAERDTGHKALKSELRDVVFAERQRGADFLLTGRFSEVALKEKSRLAVEQNITALNRRVNELGVSEPLIHQQGDDRIVVQLPGVQDPAQAKDILGRTATIEVRMVDEEAMTGAGQVPPGSKAYRARHGGQIILKNQLVYSGDNITSAVEGFDNQRNSPIVQLVLDVRGGAINQRVSGENIGRRMAIIYIEVKSEPRLDANQKPVLDAQGRPVRETVRIEEVISAPVIRSQLGRRFQIEGLDNMKEASELSLLLRAGSLAAPVEIVEERTVGPSLGADNIKRGFQSTWVGFVAIIGFMIIYYLMFGVTSSLALGANLLFLVALLSMLPTTLTLPGIAGIALTLGMAIDANVLINERIREELRNGNTPHASIHAGYDRAFGTILDSNITTLIAGLALFTFGSGPVRGFAVVLCLGILTSMFSAVTVSRALVNLVYGRRVKLDRISIGNTRWEEPRPGQTPAA
jgi:preprotein translocase subunit SecD